MITAHLPSGYVLAHLWRQRSALVMPAALLGAVFPDLDLIWFYLVDDRAVHHHRYLVHIPAFWAIVAVVALPTTAAFARNMLPGVLAFLAAVALQLILDTISGGILWAWPSPQLITFFTVPARFDPWILKFLLHWTFAFELAIWAAALTLWLRRPS